jgi:hypothetical protein
LLHKLPQIFANYRTSVQFIDLCESLMMVQPDIAVDPLAD